MIIRKAESSDIPGLARTHIAAWQAAYRGLMPDAIVDKHTVESRTANWTQTLADPATRLLVAVADDQIAGFSYFGHSREKEANPREAEMMAIYVHPDHWRHGIGRDLCRQTLEDLRGEFTSVILWVLRDNQNARRFYEAMDFECVEGKEKQLPWFGNTPEVCYRLDL